MSIKSVLQTLLVICSIIGISIIWDKGPDVLMSMIKASNYQVKEGQRAVFNSRDVLNNDYSKSNSIVRLHTLDNRFFCSGTVISDKYVLTAGHCVVNTLGKIKSENLYVVSDNLLDVKIGTAVASESQSDLALIEGDFSSFNKMKVLINPNDLDITQSEYKTCGYPRGDRLTCVKTKITGNSFFQLKGQGLIYPGDSGGPTIDTKNNIVIAVSTAVDNDGILLSPAVGLFVMFGVPVQ